MGTKQAVDPNLSRHAVRFYADDADLADAVVDHLGRGIGRGDAALVIATPDHLDLFGSRLAEDRLDVSEARRFGTLITLGATETLARFMVDGHPDPSAFDTAIGGLVRAIAATGRRPVAYGEMVAVLWEAGNVVGALELEELWNGLLARQDFSLLCAYPISSVEGHADAVEMVRNLHSEVAGIRHARRSFPALAPSAGAARRFVAEQLDAWGVTSAAEDVVLATSELATNALLHARSEFAVTVSSRDRTVRLEVDDGSASDLHHGPVAAPEASTGRGLIIVHALAHRWGSEPLATGKVVWAEFRADRPRA